MSEAEKQEEAGGYDHHHGRGGSTRKVGSCPTCRAQIAEHVRFEKKEVKNEHYYEGKDNMAFDMLMHELIARPKDNPKEKMLSGCEVFFPDTLFFKN